LVKFIETCKLVIVILLNYLLLTMLVS